MNNQSHTCILEANLYFKLALVTDKNNSFLIDPVLPL